MLSIASLKKIDLKSIKKRYWFLALTIAFILFFLFVISPPSDFKFGTTITIEKGETIKGAAISLKNNHIIRSPSLFNILIIFYEHNVVEGDYYFDKPINLLQVLYKITNGNYDIETKNITFFEGITVNQMADELVKTFPSFDAKQFIEFAKSQEGYLFPDTYRFRINVTPEIVLQETRENFNQKIAEINNIIGRSNYSLADIITMASIVEKEATSDTRQEVANILWRRIELNMPLQVDAPFVYSIDKGTMELTIKDLASDDPYNTYKFLGLTPTPIGNPGIESIIAAAQPTKTTNLYFLTGSDGQMHFAKSFEEHKRNRLLYLD